MKDIFIDNNVAKNFVNPADDNYKNLLKWLLNYDVESIKTKQKLKNEFAHLIVNPKLLTEYSRSNQNCFRNTSIILVLDKLTKEGRLIKIGNAEIKEIEQEHFTKTYRRKLLSNREDHCHICTILVSHRKMVLTLDANFKKDLENLNGIKVTISNRPENIGYQ